MLIRISVITALTMSSALASATSAQVINQPPQCPAKTVILDTLPTDVELTSLEIDPLSVAPTCVDPDGDEMTLVAVSSQAYIDENGDAATDTNILAGQSLVITFTVSDGNGGETTSTLTIKR